MPVQTKIQIRRGTTAEWLASTDPLSQGELGYNLSLKKFKVGDGTSLWNSLPWATIIGSDLVGSSGINISYATGSGIATISVTGLTSSYLSDFSSTVSGLLPVKSIVAGNGISVTPSGDAAFIVSTSGLDSNSVKDVIGSSVTGVSGVRVDYNNTSKITTVSLSDPSIQVSDITDFGSGVSGLINGLYQPYDDTLSGIATLNPSSDQYIYSTGNNLFTTGSITSLGRDLIANNATSGARATLGLGTMATESSTNYALLSGATFTGSVTVPSGSGNFNSLSVSNTPVSLSGHSHTASNITDFNTSVSGLLGVKSLVAGTGIGIGNISGVQTISVTGIPSSLITDLGNVATTQVIGRTGILLTYDAINDTMFIDTTGVSLVGHTHTWSNISDASARATLNELAYLSGVSAGTASSSRAVILDSNKSITGIGNVSTTGNLTIGGNLTVNGTTTTVNSTTVDIGDNIIRVNVSGAATQGGLEVRNSSTSGITQLVWDTDNSRWQFNNGNNVYTSGYFIGSLSGNANTVTNGVYTSDSGTVTSLMIANNTIVNDDINSSAGIAYSKLNLLSGIVNTDISSTAAIAYSKLNLSSGILDSDISSSASISINKLSSSGVTIGTTSVYLGGTASSIVGLTSISGTSTGSPTTLYNCIIDGGTP